jgi:hypothetical protein
VWSSELAQLLGDARACADACEAYLAETRTESVVAAAAVCRVLDDLADLQPQLFIAAVRVCRELATAAIDDAPPLAEPLRRVADSASAVLEASG